MVQDKKTSTQKKTFSIFPMLPPVAATLMVVFQQVYYPSANVEILFNVLFLAMSMLAFLPMVKSRPGVVQKLPLICSGYVNLLACLYNVSIIGVASPLSDFSAFLNSFCGLWILVSTIEIIVVVGPLIYKSYQDRMDREGAQSMQCKGRNTDREGSGKLDFQEATSSQTLDSCAVLHSNKTENTSSKTEKPRFSVFSKIAPFIFIVCAIVLPLMPRDIAPDWVKAVKEITTVVYGDWVEGMSTFVIVLLYIAMLFAACVTLYVLYILSVYMLGRIRKDSNSKGAGDLFQEYSTPIALFIVASTVTLAIRQVSGGNGINDITAIGGVFEWMLIVVVGIIVVFILVEAVRLVLCQCLEHGSLLKTAMRLVFTLLVQYTIEVLTGILRVMAIRDVIESILLFFIPDLEGSIEPKAKDVLDNALNKEIKKLAHDVDTANDANARPKDT